jgi:hemoglobin
MNELDDAAIHAMVHRFYEKVREDPALGPIFEERLAGSWGPHLDKMVSFWTTVLLARASYRGNPARAHAEVPAIRREHFARWLALFEQTLDELFTPDTREHVMSYARRMSVGLMTHIARSRGA